MELELHHSLMNQQTKEAFGHYACVLIDMDMSSKLFDKIMVERDEFSFYVEVICETLQQFYPNYKIIDHCIR